MNSNSVNYTLTILPCSKFNHLEYLTVNSFPVSTVPGQKLSVEQHVSVAITIIGLEVNCGVHYNDNIERKNQSLDRTPNSASTTQPFTGV